MEHFLKHMKDRGDWSVRFDPGATDRQLYTATYRGETFTALNNIDALVWIATQAGIVKGTRILEMADFIQRE